MQSEDEKKKRKQEINVVLFFFLLSGLENGLRNILRWVSWMTNEAFKYRKWKILWIYQFLFSIFSVNAFNDCFSSGFVSRPLSSYCQHSIPLSSMGAQSMLVYFSLSLSFSVFFTPIDFPFDDDMKSNNKYCYLPVTFIHLNYLLAPFCRFVLIQFAFFYRQFSIMLYCYIYLGEIIPRNEKIRKWHIRFGIVCIYSFLLTMSSFALLFIIL